MKEKRIQSKAVRTQSTDAGNISSLFHGAAFFLGLKNRALCIVAQGGVNIRISIGTIVNMLHIYNSQAVLRIH